MVAYMRLNIRHLCLKIVGLCTMGTSSESEYVTALAPEREQASASSLVSVSAVEEQIERSKCHWSELAEPDSISDSISIEEEAAAKIDNQKAFKALQMHSEWGFFFRTFGYDLGVYESAGELVVGEKFAEGGQAELYHACVKWREAKWNEWDLEYGLEWVLKVFKKGTLVRHLQDQWPHGMLQNHAELVKLTQLGKPLGPRYRCEVYCATVLEDGRFAFLMVREREDLRSRIDRKMLKRSGHGCGPFPIKDTEVMMYKVALGMDWLHNHNIVHRDLKASNVLFYKDENGLYCFVADYECSIGVVGTGFWRAPEILQACKEKNVKERPELFTREADAYSYGMTCYEILTGRLPFEGEVVTMDLVIGGQRPKVPEFVDDWALELLDLCWQSDPTKRPSFEKIMSLLEANSSSEFIKRKRIERMKANEVEILLAQGPLLM